MKNNLAAFVAACAGMFLFGVTLITLGSVATDLKVKLQLNGIAAGTLFSILPFGILTGSLIFGPVCDRYGYKLLLILACIGMFAGFEGIAAPGARAGLRPPCRTPPGLPRAPSGAFAGRPGLPQFPA